MEYKISIEGEGPRLGLKTIFFKYTGDELLDTPKLYNIYINTEVIDTKLIEYIKLSADRGAHITVETESDSYECLLSIPNVLVFKDVVSYDSSMNSYENLFIKIRLFKKTNKKILCL